MLYVFYDKIYNTFLIFASSVVFAWVGYLILCGIVAVSYDVIVGFLNLHHILKPKHAAPWKLIEMSLMTDGGRPLARMRLCPLRRYRHTADVYRI